LVEVDAANPLQRLPSVYSPDSVAQLVRERSSGNPAALIASGGVEAA
jgi:hypothetical protein